MMEQLDNHCNTPSLPSADARSGTPPRTRLRNRSSNTLLMDETQLLQWQLEQTRLGHASSRASLSTPVTEHCHGASRSDSDRMKGFSPEAFIPCSEMKQMCTGGDLRVTCVP